MAERREGSMEGRSTGHWDVALESLSTEEVQPSGVIK